MKKTLVFLVSLMMVLGMNISTADAFSTTLGLESKLKWKSIQDEDGYIVEVLDMTEEEMRNYEISQLRNQSSLISTFTSGYTYEYKYVKSVYDTGTSSTSKILIGDFLDWAQRTSYTLTKAVSISLQGAYKNITGSSTISYEGTDQFDFDKTYDNCLGLFVRLRISQYKIIKKDKYTNTVISTSLLNVMTECEKSLRQIYDKGDGNLSYKYSGVWKEAKMIKKTLTAVPTQSSDFVRATRSVFN